MKCHFPHSVHSVKFLPHLILFPIITIISTMHTHIYQLLYVTF